MIFVLVFLIMMSAYFSATETAFSTMNKIKVKNLAAGGNSRAKLALELSDDFDTMISTILIGNNIVNIASSSIATAIFIKMMGDKGVSVATAIMTVVVLIFGEISPKSMAKESPESFAMFSAPLLKAFTVVLTPVNYIFKLWKNLLSKIFKSSDDSGITEEELITFVEEAAAQDGGIGEEECELIRSAIEFNDLDVKDILTPRIDIVAVEKGDEREEIANVFAESGYSRLPIYDDTIDNILGVINEKDFHNFVMTSKKSIDDIVKPVVFTTYNMKISKLLTLLQQKKSHLAIVTDEYGGTMGLATMEDILEELVGEIWDEHDEVMEDIEQVSDNTYKVQCSANIDKVMKEFSIDEEFESSTVGGWVVDILGRIPEEGDEFEYQNLRVKVTKTEQRRAIEVMVTMYPKVLVEE